MCEVSDDVDNKDLKIDAYAGEQLGISKGRDPIHEKGHSKTF